MAAFIDAHPESGARIVESRQTSTVDALVINLELSVGQEPRNDIRRTERLLVGFDAGDANWPSVYALREDFPDRVPHLNVPYFGFPSTLCLSELPFEEVQRDWTPPYYLALIRRWLERTARGELHLPGQPVEPFLLPHGTLIVPHQLLKDGLPAANEFFVLHEDDDTYRFVAQAPGENIRPTGAMVFTLPARVVDRINAVPRTLAELARIADGEGFDLVAAVKERLREWRYDANMRAAVLLIILQVPLKAAQENEIEHYDINAFIATEASVQDVAVSLDLWDRDDPRAAVLFPDPSRGGADISVSMLGVQKTLDAANAASYNGESPLTVNYAVVGAGALGSQMVVNLSRGGLRPIAVIDSDHLLPHNLARHTLLSDSLGRRKAAAVAETINAVLDEPRNVDSIYENVVWPTSKESKSILEDASVILDVSASVAVARYIALRLGGAARRISVFLNPTGSDLVLLAEDEDRSSRLDQLEMQYYWAVVSDSSLSQHLSRGEARRYSGGCRDTSSQIRQTSVAVHAGLGAAAVRRTMMSSAPSAFIWRLDESAGEVKRMTLPTRPMRTTVVAGWNLFVAENVLVDFGRLRSEALPSETGGVLIGSIDMQNEAIYVVGLLEAPSDSVAWPTGYIRGSFGLRGSIDAIREKTSGNLTYVGEWHSHPRAASTHPSEDDRKAFKWMQAALDEEGRPGVMAIVGDENARFVLSNGDATIDLRT